MEGQDKALGLSKLSMLFDLFKDEIESTLVGAPGVSISKVEQTTMSDGDGGENVVTITLSDGTVSTFNIKNGSKGDTGAKGEKGDPGEKGETGNTGNDGAQGVSITKVEQTTTSSVDSGDNVITVTLSNGTSSTFKIKNGSKGNIGSTGATGIRGSRWTTGTAITGTSTTATIFSSSGITDSLVNDMYLNTSTWYIYRCSVAGASNVAKWVYVGSIKGATGATGADGKNGTNATTTAVVSTTANGLAPKCGGTTTKFLRDDGTWATPPDTNTTYGNASASAAGLVSTVAQTFAGAKTFNGSIYASGATAAGTQQCRNLAVGTAAATASNCPSGCWYGQYS